MKKVVGTLFYPPFVSGSRDYGFRGRFPFCHGCAEQPLR